MDVESPDRDEDLPPLPERRGFMKWYAHPATQTACVGIICFCCPGLFNALSGIGGGGQVNSEAASNGNVALYSTFAVFGFFGGTVNNRLGSRLTLGLGAVGYALYVASLLSYNINQNDGFVIGAGAVLGVCAGLLWTAQGSMVLAYATEATKGRMLALFWAIFNCGAVLGNIIEFGLTYHSTSNTVSNSVYITFLVLTALGSLLPALLVDPALMVRSDGTRVRIPLHPTWYSELGGLVKCLAREHWIFLLFPMFLASNWFYTWQFNDFNGSLFTLRTRSLNSMLYYFFQIFGAGLFGFLIDLKSIRRKTRAWIGLAVVMTFVMTLFGGSYHYQKGYTRADIGVIPRIDLKDSNYAGYIILYILMGIMDSIFQNYCYWLMGTLSDSPRQLAYLVGMYKGVQSAGAVGVFRMDAEKKPFMTILASTWGLTAGSLLFAAILIAIRVTDRTEVAPGEEVDDAPETVKEKPVGADLDEKRASLN